MKKLILILFVCISPIVYANVQPVKQEAAPKIDWFSYAHLRAASNFDDYTSLMIRRLKFWLKSTPEFSDKWSFKVQVLFTSNKQEKLFLQDAQAKYHVGLFSFDFGQFKPEYSLQRFQPDYLIPAIERAKAITRLIPDGTMGVRDLGVQGNFHTRDNLLETHIGLFNGYGINEYRFNNSGYLLTHKTGLNINLEKDIALKFGYSLQYRKAQNLKIPKVLPDSVYFTGNDFRYNLFALFASKYFDIQGEYLNADLDGDIANGYYILSTVKIKKNQVVLGFEDYKDLITTTNNKPYYRIGYNFLFNKYRMMLFVDNYFQYYENKIQNYTASIQFQYFIK